MLKLVFAGTPDVAVPSLKAFAADPRFDVVGVITRPDAPTGRGRKLTPSPVKATALELGLPVIDLKPRSPEFMEALNDLHVDALAAVGEGTATFTAQPAESLEYAHKITVEDARISWTDEAEAIDRQIRACTPHPGAWTELFAEGPIADNDESTAKSLALHILAAQPADQSNPNTPAELQPGELKVGKKNVWVGTGSTPLELTQVKAQGKKAMRAADWARGARLSPAACVR